MSLRLKSFCRIPASGRVRSVVVRTSRSAGRPIVLPAALPTFPRVSGFGSRAPATFSADRSAVLLPKESPGLVPIVLPIRELDFIVTERESVADCFFVIETGGSFLPIILPMPRPRSVRGDDWLLLIRGEVTVLDMGEVEGLVELTAGCFAPVGAEELRVPIILPIRERWLVVGSFCIFERDGVLRLLEPPIREAPLERAAGCSALLGTDGLVVLIVLPIREVMLGLIRLLVLVADLSVVMVRVLLLGLVLSLLSKFKRLLDGVLVLIELPIRDVMFELMPLLELGAVERELIVLVSGARLVMLRLEVLLLGARLVIALLELLLGARLVIALLELLLGAWLVIALLELLLLGARLVIALLELLLLGALLVIALLELLLDETLLELLDDDDLDVDLGAGAGVEACWLCPLELLDLLLPDRVLAAITGSQNNKRANSMQKTKKSEPSRRDAAILTFNI